MRDSSPPCRILGVGRSRTRLERCAPVAFHQRKRDNVLLDAVTVTKHFKGFAGSQSVSLLKSVERIVDVAFEAAGISAVMIVGSNGGCPRSPP